MSVRAVCRLRSVACTALLFVAPLACGTAELSWSYATPPVEGRINGDAVPDFVALCSETDAGNPTRVCAVDGATFKLLWRSQPLDDVAAKGRPLLGIAGGRVALVDQLARIHLYDLATGTALPSSLRLDDRSAQICNPVEEPGNLWLASMSSDSGWMVDPAQAKITSARRPWSCMIQYGQSESANPGVAPIDYRTAVPLPRFPGVHAYTALVDGDDGAATVVPNEGAPHVRLLGFTPASQGRPTALRWQREIVVEEPLRAQVAGPRPIWLSGGRIIVQYDDVSSGNHLEAIDPKTGTTRWDVAAGSYSNTRVTTSRIYQYDAHAIQVRDAATGKVLGHVGRDPSTSR